MPRLPDRRFVPDCAIQVDGGPLPARAGESVATALVAAGRVLIARSAKYHRPRGSFCLSGSCHQCLARVDGAPNQRTCLVRCRPGLVVESQNAVPTAGLDLLGVIDHVYAHGLDHHHLMTWSAVANEAAVAVSRRLAGAGTLPAQPPPGVPDAIVERFDAVVIGAGPAGLGAADVLTRRGARVLLTESDGALGGRLRCMLGGEADPPLAWASQVQRAVLATGGEVRVGSPAVGIWRDGGSPIVVLRSGTGEEPLALVRARAIVVATGTHAVPPVLPRNDLPGIFAGRAVARMVIEDGVVPGSRCLVAGTGDERARTARLLRRTGVTVVETDDVAAAIGGRRIRGVVVEGRGRIRCDALIWCGARSPATELAREGGAEVTLAPDGEWHVRVDERGATATPGLFAAGEVVASSSAAEAVAAGRRAGEASLGD